MSFVNGNTALAYARIWHEVNAKEQILGRLATRIATALIGKYKPIYNEGTDCGDYVVVTNAKFVQVSGRKYEEKLYRYHTGYPGGLKEIPFKVMMERRPDEIIRKAVSGMLPKNLLRDKRLKRLLIFLDDEHPYEQNIIKRYDLQ